MSPVTGPRRDTVRSTTRLTRDAHLTVKLEIMDNSNRPASMVPWPVRVELNKYGVLVQFLNLYGDVVAETNVQYYEGEIEAFAWDDTHIDTEPISRVVIANKERLKDVWCEEHSCWHSQHGCVCDN